MQDGVLFTVYNFMDIHSKPIPKHYLHSQWAGAPFTIWMFAMSTDSSIVKPSPVAAKLYQSLSLLDQNRLQAIWFRNEIFSLPSVFFPFLRLLFCSWYHRVLWHACVSKQKITSLPQNIGFIWPIISASFKKILWKSQGEEVKIYASSRSHIIYIFFYLIFIHWLFFNISCFLL